MSSGAKATGKSRGLGMAFYEVDKNVLSVAIKDQSAEMNGWDLSNMERFSVGEGYSDMQSNRPSSFDRIEAYYNALYDMMVKKTANVASVSSPEGISTFNSKNQEKFKGYSIDWGYQDLSEGSLVRVKVGIDEREKEERLKEEMEESLRERPLNIPKDFSFKK